jgi:CheY-like chemotaxis protein
LIGAPVGPTLSAFAARARTRPHGRFSVTTILFVEDNEMNADMLSRRLARRGFTVSVAVDGRAGLDQARSLRPDLILLDISLPVMDGWEVARELKASDDTRSIPIVALTAHALAGDREKALEAGCDDYDSKPVDFVRLMGKIEAVLAKR